MVSVVAYHPTTREFTAEEAPAGTAEPELSIEALKLRVRQQELLADYGVLALRGTPFPQLLEQAAQVVADGLKAEFAKVLKYMPEEKDSSCVRVWAGSPESSGRPLSVLIQNPLRATRCKPARP